MRSCNWMVLISRLAKFIGPYRTFCRCPVLMAAWKGKSYTLVLKSTVRNWPLLIGSQLISPWYMTIVDEGNLKNNLERQKVRHLRSSLRKQPTFRDATTGFLKLVEEGGRGGRAQASRGIFGGHLRLDGSIARICKKSVIPLPIMGQRQRISHCPFGMYDTIIHRFRSGWCPTSHFGSAANVSGWNRNSFSRVEEVCHILRSLKLVFIHFVEDFLHCKVRSFF